MKKIINKTLFGCAMALTVFNAITMISKTDSINNNKKLSKLENLSLYTSFIKTYVPKLEKTIINKCIEDKQLYALLEPQHGLKLNIPQKKLTALSSYFNTFLKSEYGSKSKSFSKVG